MDDFEAELAQQLEDERSEAIRQGRPYAVPCNLGLMPSAGAPMPTLLASESRAILVFYLEGSDDNVGKVEFEGVWSSKIGEPDEESIMKHTLIGSGFDGFSSVEVIGSDWIAEIQHRLSAHSNFKPENFEGRHFLIPFHDSTFECVAESFQATECEADFEAVIRECAGILHFLPD